MSARVLIVVMSLLSLGFRLIKMRLADIQRKQPLPEEVADVYDQERYQKYLNYVADNRKSGLIFTGINLVLTAVLYFSDMFHAIETATGGNPYLIFLATFCIFTVIETIVETIEDYHSTFHIEEKYGLNRQTKKDFARDTLLDILQNVLVLGGLALLFVFIGEHLALWTSGFSVSFRGAFLIGLAMLAVIMAFVLLASVFSIWILKKQYTFTPMPDGELRSKIMALQDSSKKKVKLIYIYDESKKSTSKNAFLLKLLWHREFGIADNFINENAEEELLAVLSHEIGHLKHKKNVLNYLRYLEGVIVFLIVVFLIYQPQLILNMNAWIRSSFDISVNNYYVWLTVVSSVLTPILHVIGVFDNYRSRQEEHEADREAVNNGYGEALIATFKQLSSDELVNVNPHPLIEFLEYDHPGMYQRIRAIREAERKRI